MKALIMMVCLIFCVSCTSLKISGEFKMNDGSSFKFENAKIKINNKDAVIKTKTGETKIDMKKVSNIDIDIK